MKYVKKVINVGKIFASVALIPAWFTKIFHGVGHLPDQSNPDNIVRVDYYHSMYENVLAETYAFLFPMSIGFISVTVILAIVGLIYPKSQKIWTAGNVLFLFTLFVFLISIILASTVERSY